MEIKQTEEGEKFNLKSRNGHREITIWWSEKFNCWMARTIHGIEFKIEERKR